MSIPSARRGMFTLVRETLFQPLQANERPVERYQKSQNQAFDDRQYQADTNQVLSLEISVGVAQNQHRRLVDKHFSARGEVPDHRQSDGVRSEERRVGKE